MDFNIGKILTLDNLIKRNMALANQCCMCKEGIENADNLLLHFSVATEFWYCVFFFFFGCIGVYCVVPFKVINSFFVGKVSFIGIVIVGSMTVIMFWGGAE